jgi:PAS domain S-box-containing protein
LAEQRTYLAPYEAALQVINDRLDRLQWLTEDNPRQQSRLPGLRALVTKKLEELARSITLVQQGDRPAALRIVKSDEGRRLMDELRLKVGEMEQEEKSLLQEREQATRRAFHVAVLTGSLASLSGVLAVVLIAWLLHRHLTARNLAEFTIAEQGERLRTTLASIGDAVLTTDKEGRITGLNAVAESLTGWKTDAAVGQPLDVVFRIVNEETRKSVANPATRALREGVIVGLANHTLLIARDGTERPIDDSAAPIRCKAGEVVGCVLVFRDVTERRHAEKELHRFAAELSEANRHKDEFLATLAHELRNPLAPLRNALHILKLSGVGPQMFEQTREMMERQLQNMVRLVDDLLDVSRITRGKIELRKEHVGLAVVVQSAVETSRPLIEAGKHELNVSLPSEPIYVNADITRLAQVFANLLNNSAKYTQRGGRIWLTVERQGSDAVVRVRDNGVGIAADQMPRLFQMFAQVDGSLERSQGGLGIGLTLVKRLVEMHGGSVEGNSEGCGKGAEFVVRLPLADTSAGGSESQAAGQRSQGTSTGPRRRIVVADDNEDSAASLAMLLRLLGHEVHVAHDGVQAAELATTIQPDLVLLDIGMPNLNGYEAARKIRSLPGGKKIVLVAVTGWGQDEDQRRATEAGFDHHLTKPADPAALGKIIGTVGRVDRPVGFGHLPPTCRTDEVA